MVRPGPRNESKVQTYYGEQRTYQLRRTDPTETIEFKHYYERIDMGANTKQVGGTHYRQRATASGMQHWDVVAEFSLDYFQGQITKYVMRWKEKNGVQDLHKALHFLEKYIELSTPSIGKGGPVRRVPEDNEVEEIIEDWAREEQAKAEKYPTSEFAKVLKAEDERDAACLGCLGKSMTHTCKKHAKHLHQKYNPDADVCAHGNHVAECNACMVESDLRYDANREKGL